MRNTSDHAQVVVNPFVIYIATGLAALLLSRLLPLPFLDQGLARLIGLLIMVASFAAGLPAVLRFFAAKTSPNPAAPSTSLVLSGPYRFTRNPMYMGLTAMYAGLMTFAQLGWGLVLLPVVVWLITAWVIVPEEKYLAGKFGPQYLGYKERVRRWI